jgi:hypothetical protein
LYQRRVETKQQTGGGFWTTVAYGSGTIRRASVTVGATFAGYTILRRAWNLELELGRERRTAARDARRARGQSIGRPKALDQSKVGLAQRMHASGESASTIAATLGVSRATVYRVLAEGA